MALSREQASVLGATDWPGLHHIFVIFVIFVIFIIIILRFCYHVNELSDNAEAASGSSQGKEQVVLLHLLKYKKYNQIKIRKYKKAHCGRHQSTNKQTNWHKKIKTSVWTTVRGFGDSISVFEGLTSPIEPSASTTCMYNC